MHLTRLLKRQKTEPERVSLLVMISKNLVRHCIQNAIWQIKSNQLFQTSKILYAEQFVGQEVNLYA
jgi:hypothetical protein